MQDKNMKKLLNKLMAGENLTVDEATQLMTAVMTGQAGEIRTAAFLTALSMKGETATEIESFSRSMRKAAVSWQDHPPEVLFDTCGTGGDSANILNISTLAALVLAALNIPVAKHGNRAVSSGTGSADLLEEMGISFDLTHEEVAQCLNENGICFLFAPKWHPAMKHAAPVRRTLAVRTVFNLLGPITNPAPVTHQVVGVYDGSFLETIGYALAGLGRKGAFVVHSEDGLDEVSIAAPTKFVRVENSRIVDKGVLNPEDFGFRKYDLAELKVQERKEAVRRTKNILNGKGSEVENAMVCANAGLALSLIRHTADMKECAAECLDTLKAGKGAAILEKWIQFRNTAGSVTSLG